MRQEEFGRSDKGKNGALISKAMIFVEQEGGPSDIELASIAGVTSSKYEQAIQIC